MGRQGVQDGLPLQVPRRFREQFFTIGHRFLSCYLRRLRRFQNSLQMRAHKKLLTASVGLTRTTPIARNAMVPIFMNVLR